MNEFLQACHQVNSPEPDEQTRALTGEFLKTVGTELNGQFPAVAINTLPQLPPHGAAWLAVVFGSAVESGFIPDESGPAVLELLTQWAKSLPEVDDETEELPEVSEQQKLLLEAMPMMARSAVAHLSKLPDLREQLAKSGDVIEAIMNAENYTHAATWVREAIMRKSGDIVILHVQSKKGMLLHYENVNFNFHLFSLIQTCVGTRFPGGKIPSQKIMTAAQAESNEKLNDTAWWHYGNPLKPESGLNSMIWGEGNVREIPEIDGVQVLLLWPGEMERGWDSGFFSPRLDAMMPDMRLIRDLSGEEVENWFLKLNIPADVNG